LAWSLVQLGAGIVSKNPGSVLALCDSQRLTSENVGRHFLGMNYIGQYKSTSLRTELMLRRPGISIEDIPKYFSEVESRLGEFDLIINASGYESFGRHISKLVRQLNWFSQPRALLHIWVEGRGGVTRSHLKIVIRRHALTAWGITRSIRNRDCGTRHIPTQE
jgi:hypothetical protein